MIGSNYQVNAAQNQRSGFSGLSTVPIEPKSIENNTALNKDLVSADYASAIMAYNTPRKYSVLPQNPSVEEAIRFEDTNKKYGFTYRLKTIPTCNCDSEIYKLEVYNKKGERTKAYEWFGGQAAENYSGRYEYFYDGSQSKPVNEYLYKAGDTSPSTMMECYEFVPAECFTRNGLSQNMTASDYTKILDENGIKYELKNTSNGDYSVTEYDDSGQATTLTEFNSQKTIMEIPDEDEKFQTRQYFINSDGSDEKCVVLKKDCTEVYTYLKKEASQ